MIWDDVGKSAACTKGLISLGKMTLNDWGQNGEKSSGRITKPTLYQLSYIGVRKNRNCIMP